jgi:hypothetical protein
MPRWTQTPPADSRNGSLPLLRTPATTPLRAIITSPALVGCDTHFYGGHTVPCERPNCKACLEGIPYRWHAYVAAYSITSNLHFIFECTAQAAQKLVDYQTDHGTLRGCAIEAYRWHKRPNGRVVIQTTTTGTPLNVLPPAPDLAKVMAIIWSLPPQNVEADPEATIPIALAATSKGNGQSANPKLYASPNP